MSCPRIFAFAFIFAFTAFIISCGGGNAPLRGSSFNNDKPITLTRAGELAKLEALPKPANLTGEQWLGLKDAMAALVPEKAVCVPPRADEAVTDFAFVNDGGATSFTWSYYLRNDYNLDGIVDVADVTAIADHYGEAVGDSPTNWIIDTSGDGIVDIADVTGIATRYGLSLLSFSLRLYTSETEYSEIALVPRGHAVYSEDGYMHFSYVFDSTHFDTTRWADYAVVPVDLRDNFGPKSNVVQYRPPRITSVTVPSGKVGDMGTFSAVVEGAEPLAYDWVLSNGCNPKRSTEPSVEVTFIAQGSFSGKLTVANIFGSAETTFSLKIGVPPTITSVVPLGGTTGARIPFSAAVMGSYELQYSWNFGPGSFPSSSTEVAPQAVFDNDGQHSCSLTVTNDWGVDTFPFTVTTGSAPQIVKVEPLRGGVGSSVTFSAEVLGTAPFTYSWDFLWLAQPSTSGDAAPTVTIVGFGDALCKLVVSNMYGETTYYFTVHGGQPPSVFEVYATSHSAGTVCYFFAETLGDIPITLFWTFDMFAPEPPYQVYGAVPVLVLPSTPGEYNCNVTATSEYGTDSHDFTFVIDGQTT